MNEHVTHISSLNYKTNLVEFSLQRALLDHWK